MAARRKIGLVLLTVLFATVAAAGCDGLRPDFRMVTVKGGIGRFSFEYPGRYRVDLVEVKDTFTNVTLSGPPFVKDMVSTYGSVFVIMWGSEPDIEQIVNKDIENWETPNTYPDLVDFVLMERSLITTGGIAGQQVKYSANSLLTDSDIARGLSPVTLVTRRVYLALERHFWKLTWTYQQTDAQSDAAFEADFDHMLGTFKILD
jgi:hypothetical protein